MGNPIVARPLGQQRMLPIDSSEKRPRHLSASLVPNFQKNTFFQTAEEFMTESFYLGLSQNRGTSKLGWFRFGSLYTSPKRVQKTTLCLPPLSLSRSLATRGGPQERQGPLLLVRWVHVRGECREALVQIDPQVVSRVCRAIPKTWKFEC